MGDEVLSRPRVAGEELGWQQVALEAIARATRQHDVAGRMGAAVGERVHVIERRQVELESRAAVDAATTTVAHGRSLERSLQVAWRNLLEPAADARGREGDTVEVSTT